MIALKARIIENVRASTQRKRRTHVMRVDLDVACTTACQAAAAVLKSLNTERPWTLLDRTAASELLVLCVAKNKERAAAADLFVLAVVVRFKNCEWTWDKKLLLDVAVQCKHYPNTRLASKTIVKELAKMAAANKFVVAVTQVQCDSQAVWLPRAQAAMWLEPVPYCPEVYEANRAERGVRWDDCTREFVCPAVAAAASVVVTGGAARTRATGPTQRQQAGAKRTRNAKRPRSDEQCGTPAPFDVFTPM